MPPIDLHSKAPPVRTAGSHRILLSGALLFTTIAILGSFYPWKYKGMAWDAAVQNFSQLSFFTFGVLSRIDWVSNCLLFFPLGFFWTAVVAQGLNGRPTGRSWSLPVALVMVVVGCVVLGATIEFAQHWFPPRVVNPFDVQAQCVGTILGGVAWWLAGTHVEGWLRRFRWLGGPQSNQDKLFIAYLLLWFFGLVLPLDISIDPTEVVSKLRMGRLEIIPFSKQPLFGLWTWGGILFTALAAFPIGAAMVTLGVDAHARTRSVWRAGIASIAIILFGELAQVPVMSRVASTVDILAGLTGAGLGVVWRLRSLGAVDWTLRTDDFRIVKLVVSAAAYLVYSLGLAAVFWWPLRVTRKRVSVIGHLSAAWRRPLFHWLTSDDGFDFATKSKLLWFVPLGVLWAFLWRRAVDPNSRWRATGIVIGVAVAALTAAGLELGQALFPPHVPDLTDALLGTGFATLGLAGTWFWLRPRFGGGATDRLSQMINKPRR